METIKEQARTLRPLAQPQIYGGKRSRLRVYACSGGRKHEAHQCWTVEIGELETAVRDAARLYPRGYLLLADYETRLTLDMARALDSSHYD